ncbi:MAG: phosphoglucosamine mutase [Clostridiales bacterium]|jgi:phosphoglucosamine mutase|nr:phosphoglucosamine mutase [Clostridiales bacterium]
MGKLFGTDGIRGLANIELTPELAFKIGRAGAYVLSKDAKHAATIMVGMDTRLSGGMLEAALSAGMCSVGAKVIIVGVIPTPAIAYLTKKHGFDAGVVISASHNPFEDNGIKFFSSGGIKLSDQIEEEIESYILYKMDEIPRISGPKLGYREYSSGYHDEYIEFLVSTLGGSDLKGLKVILDCANGATFKVAAKAYEKLGCELIIIHNDPDGKNINDNCGSTHMESLVEAVKKEKADIGVAYDGDGDRCLLVDALGNLVDGDQILSICACYLQGQGKLKNNGLVGTVMSNLGLAIMCRNENIEFIKTDVGDRYVLEKMLSDGYSLGGEQSGHVIFLDHTTTGDGILTSLQVLKIIKEKNTPLHGLNNKMSVLPQVLINAKVSNGKKNTYLEHGEIRAAIDKLEKMFNGNGRVLIRPSGTEPLVRVMLEGEDIETLNFEARNMADMIENLLA